jgi:hypothetical protein
MHADNVVTTFVCPYFVKTPMIDDCTPVSRYGMSEGVGEYMSAD